MNPLGRGVGSPEGDRRWVTGAGHGRRVMGGGATPLATELGA